MRLSRRSVLLAPFAAAVLSRRAFAADPQAVAPIQALDQALLSAMKAGKTAPFAQRSAIIAPAVDRAFDLPTILRTAVGLRWSTIPANEQAQLLDAFRKFTVASYTANFDSYNGERIEVQPSSRTVGADQVVETKIIGGDDTRIDYVMHNVAGAWKAVDVLLNGAISQVAVYRSDWRVLLASGAPALISRLQSRTAQLSGGALR